MMQPTQGLAREDAPLESTWNREAVYSSWEAWDADYQKALNELPALELFSGQFGDGPEVLVDWFETHSRHERRALKLAQFARLAVAMDGNDHEAKGRLGQGMSLLGKFYAAAAFAEPELMEIGERLLSWAGEEPRLAVYRHYLENLLRLKPHRRSAEVEEILNMLETPFRGTAQTAGELTNTDLKFQNAIDSQGQTHPVHQGTPPPKGITSPDRAHRRTAWESYCDAHQGMENTLATNYLTSLQQQVFLAQARGYDSILELRLSPTNLPVSVFHNLIDTFQRNLPIWHRYWDVRRRVLKLDEIQPYDIWAPVVESPHTIPYQQAVDWLCESLAPLGESYVRVLRHGALEGRWVDYAPNVGKRQGAASSRRIDMPPFIFMSYYQDMMSASILAHELGHSMHSYLADEHQPTVYTSYGGISSTVTETASNFHQAMLRAYLQDTRGSDRDFQIALIDEAMFNFHRYFFIMPTLARFELEVTSRAMENQPMTAKTLNQIMQDLYAEGYGDTLTDDPQRTATTWAQFSTHLYMPFYTFQYAVGISAAHVLADEVRLGSSEAVERYLAFLQAGGSRYPLDLFQLAGVDMTTPEPIEKAFSVLSDMVDRLEDLAA